MTDVLTARAAEEPVALKPDAQPIQHIDIFPTRIWQVRLAALTEHLPAWAAAAEALRAATPISPQRSIRGGWTTTDLNADEQETFRDLLQHIGMCCRLVLVDCGTQDPKFRLQSWINIQDRGGFNFLHAHCGALLSGSFYIQVPEGSGNLVLRDPRPGIQYGSVSGAGPNALADIALGPEAGLLRIFPPWLEHYVEPHDSDTHRIVLSFNAVRWQ